MREDASAYCVSYCFADGLPDHLPDCSAYFLPHCIPDGSAYCLPDSGPYYLPHFCSDRLPHPPAYRLPDS